MQSVYGNLGIEQLSFMHITTSSQYLGIALGVGKLCCMVSMETMVELISTS